MFAKNRGRNISTDSKNTDEEKYVRITSTNSITGWRLWLFRIIAVTVVPALLFLFLALGLRIIGYGYSASTTVKCKLNGKDFYRNNWKFGWRFFPRDIARASESFIFSSDKPDDVYRIFILGASAANGSPHPAFGFGRFLEVMLRRMYPGVKFEIINTAMVAINSHVVLPIARDCARHESDLFIVYLGNNEVTGPYGAGTVYTVPGSNLSLIRASIAFKGTRLGQMITALFRAAGTGKKLPRVWEGLKMFLENQIRADEDRLRTVYRNFQENQEDICQVARKSKIDIICCTVGSNLKDCSPFASAHRANLTEVEKRKWDSIYNRGVLYERSGKYAEAVERYLAAAEIDDAYADLQFRLGRCYWSMKEYDMAKARYIDARQLDTLRFRSDTRINEIIRAVAGDREKENIYLVDVVNVFEKNSPHQTLGKELFYEHVHLNFKGNYLLAKSVFEQVEKILPERIKRQRVDKRLFLTESECAESLVYTDWSRYGITEKVLNGFIKEPPFTNQLNNKRQVRQMEEELEQIKSLLTLENLERIAEQYRQAIQERPSDYWLGTEYGMLLLEAFNDESAAIREYRMILNYMPHHYGVCSQLGTLLCKHGDFELGENYIRRAIRLYPADFASYYNLAFACQSQNQLDKAVKYYYEALRLQPNHIPAYDGIAVVLTQLGKIDEAVQMCRKGLFYAPERASLHVKLGLLLYQQGNKDVAINELRTASQLDPNSARIREMLNALLKRN